MSDDFVLVTDINNRRRMLNVRHIVEIWLSDDDHRADIKLVSGDIVSMQLSYGLDSLLHALGGLEPGAPFSRQRTEVQASENLLPGPNC